jgi:hypothetical protein
MELDKSEVGAQMRFRDNDPPNLHPYLQPLRRMSPHKILADDMG